MSTLQWLLVWVWLLLLLLMLLLLQSDLVIHRD